MGGNNTIDGGFPSGGYVYDIRGRHERSSERPERSKRSANDNYCPPDNNDFCYARWEEEDSACWQWKNLGIRVVKACQSRATTRRDLCYRNGGKPNPSEPPQYNPFVDYPR